MDDTWVPDQLTDSEVTALLTHLDGAAGGAADDPRARLRSLLAERRSSGASAIYPLSWNQTSLWYLHELDPTSSAYHVGGAMQLRVPIDVAAFERAVQAVTDRHAALRTTMATIGGHPFQLVHERMPTPVVHADVGALSHEALVAQVQRDYDRPVDLRQGPGLLVKLYHGHGEPVVLVRIHHALMDLWSLAVVFYDLGNLYAAERDGVPAQLAPPGAQYPEYVRWQRELLARDAGRTQEAYWLGQLAGMPHVLELPTDHARPPVQSLRGHAARFAFDVELTTAFGQLARRLKATQFVVLLAAYQTVLHRITGQDDLGVGVPVAGRNQAQHRDMVGHCVNMAVLRGRFEDDPSFAELVARTKRLVGDAMRNEDHPFAQLVGPLGVAPDQSRPPLFQASLVYQQSPLIDMSSLVFEVRSEDRPVDIGGIVLDPFPMRAQQGQFELSLWAAKVGKRLHGEVKLDAALFDLGTGERLGRQLETLLRAAIADPEMPVSRLPLLDEVEQHRILQEWNDTATPVRDDVRLERLVAEQAARIPDAVAIASADRALTYAELLARSAQLSHHLRAAGVASGDLVGVMADRSPDTAVALLGILFAGAGYVPLEAHYPDARVAFILDSLGIRVAVSEDAFATRLEGLPTMLETIVRLDRDDLDAWPTAPPDPAGLSPDATAYIIFTSGSTGTPKGVSVRHRPVSNIIDWVNRTRRVGPGDRLLFITSLSFDLSVYDVFGALAAGATIRIASREEIQDPYRLMSLLVEDGITIWDSAPPALNQLVPFLPAAAPDSPLRLVMLSGDWIPVKLPDQVRTVFPNAQVLSLGGATEATIWSNFHEVGEVDPTWPSIPYGTPVQNARYYILDRHRAPVPVGVPGDLYIGGPVLADGYVNDPELTASKFVPDPFVDDPDARMYDTGDRARFFEDGTIEFLGRRDFQVKIRGFRIELGEIEAVLGEHPAVADCLVMARDDDGERYLTAYVVPHGGAALEHTDVRSHLLTRLPEFMVPGHTVVLDSLPLTPNGKVDRKALPPPERRRDDLRTAYVEPADDRERLLAEIWRDVLGVDRVGATDNFFDLGGDSLHAVRMVYEIEMRTGAIVAIAALLRSPTVRQLASLLDGDPQQSGLLVPLREGEGAPLFLLHPSGGEVVAYRALAAGLGEGCPLVGVRSRSRAGGSDPASVDLMAKAYAEEIRAAQPEGPYRLAGWSLGGVLAHAVAGQLERRGATVALCAILDSVLPASRPDLVERTLFRLGALLGPLSGALASRPEEELTALLSLPEQDRLREALRLARAEGDDVADLPQEILQREIVVAEQHAGMLAGHRPSAIAAPVTVLWAEHSTDGGTPLTDWGSHTRCGATAQVLPGANHFTLWRPPHVAAVCAWLDEALHGTGR